MAVTVEGNVGNRAHTETRFAGPPELALKRARDAALRIPQAKIVSSTADAIEVKVGVTFKSWGEGVRVSAQPQDDETLLGIESWSRLPWTLADWGKNRRNVETVLNGL